MAARLTRIPSWALVLTLVLLGVASMGRQWGGPILWELDGLFYQSHVQQLRGEGREEAIRGVFSGPLSVRAREIEAASEDHRRVRDAAWPLYTERFYARRWLLPAIAAAIYPVLGEHSLETLSLLGYVLIAPLLFLLLRRRFAPLTAFAVSAVALVLPPLRDWAVFPLTDTWGIALLVAGLLVGLTAYERGLRWLPLWMLCVLALAFTRDTAFLLVVAAGLLTLVRRDRRSLALAAGGFVAALPAPLIWSVGVREQLAFVLDDHAVPHDTSWSFVLDRYPGHLGDVADRYLDYAVGHPLVILFFVVGIGGALLLGSRRDPFFVLLFGCLAGYLLLLALGPSFSIFRYELVLVPLAAAGLALVAERAAHALAHARQTRRLAPTPEGVSSS